MALSKAVVGASSSARAIRLHGMIHGHSVLVLVDSGSSSSFISLALASKLNGISSTPTHSEVRVAGGSILLSPAICHQLSWSVGDCTFQTDLRVLSLSSYDLIVGMDWLESLSPMQIHWHQKWLMIPYQGSGFSYKVSMLSYLIS
jgi:predicted aspartyl protease